MQKLMRAMHKNEKGFTLVELMVVVVIIGILVAIAIPIYNEVTARANRNTVEANLRIIDGAVEMYKAELGADPADINALTDAYIVAVPTGPGGTTYQLNLDNRAEATKDDADAWFTATSPASLPVDWQPTP